MYTRCISCHIYIHEIHNSHIICIPHIYIIITKRTSETQYDFYGLDNKIFELNQFRDSEIILIHLATFFSKDNQDIKKIYLLIQKFNPRSIKSIAICKKYDNVIGELAKKHGIEVVVFEDNEYEEKFDNPKYINKKINSSPYSWMVLNSGNTDLNQIASQFSLKFYWFATSSDLLTASFAKVDFQTKLKNLRLQHQQS